MCGFAGKHLEETRQNSAVMYQALVSQKFKSQSTYYFGKYPFHQLGSLQTQDVPHPAPSTQRHTWPLFYFEIGYLGLLGRSCLPVSQSETIIILLCPGMDFSVG
jgi:hypothetical protein